MTTNTDDILARSNATIRMAHRAVKNIATETLADELVTRGYDVFLPPKTAVPAPTIAGPPARGYQEVLVLLPNDTFLAAWSPELDGRPPSGSGRFGVAELHPGSAKRGECTTCVRDRKPVGPAAWRMCNNNGTTMRTYCLECAQDLVNRLNTVFPQGHVVLPTLVPKRDLVVPDFATAEEALAWLDQQG